MIAIGTHHKVEKQESERMSRRLCTRKPWRKGQNPTPTITSGAAPWTSVSLHVRVISRAYQIVLAVKLARHSSFSPFFRQPPPCWLKKFVDGVLRMQHIMIMKTAAVHSRIEPEIKEQAEGILQQLGLSPTEAIRMFYTQITLRNGLPFDVAIPNDVTIKALEDSRNGRNLERFDSTEKLFESWNA
jgi:DNA-damage-inducible protein J